MWGRDSIALTIVGRNLKTIAIMTAACASTYTGVYLMNWWNEQDRRRQGLPEYQEVAEEDIHFFYEALMP